MRTVHVVVGAALWLVGCGDQRSSPPSAAPPSAATSSAATSTEPLRLGVPTSPDCGPVIDNIVRVFSSDHQGGPEQAERMRPGLVRPCRYATPDVRACLRRARSVADLATCNSRARPVPPGPARSCAEVADHGVAILRATPYKDLADDDLAAARRTLVAECLDQRWSADRRACLAAAPDGQTFHGCGEVFPVGDPW